MLESRLGRAERVLSMSRAMLGIVITVMLLLVFSLVNGEPGSAPYVVSILTMGINILFIPYIIYTTSKYVRMRQALIKALDQSVLETTEHGMLGDSEHSMLGDSEHNALDATAHNVLDTGEHSVLEAMERELSRRD